MNNISVKICTNNEIEAKFNPCVNYLKCKNKFTGVRYLKECCMKLKCSVLTAALAATYYHKFFLLVNFDDYDCFLISCTCIYLASKVNDDDVKIRDIINVGYNCIHRKDAPLSLDPYFELRDSLVEAELLLMRMLKFDLKVNFPHRHMLFFLSSLKEWLGESVFKEVPIVQTSWTILNDSYHMDISIKYSPQAISGAILSMVMDTYGIYVEDPINSMMQKKGTTWYTVLHEDCTENNVKEIRSAVMKMYEIETEVVSSM